MEQDGATPHTCKTNAHLLNKLFGNDGWIQNPPNSPDLSYPIEDLWAIIKPRVKRRNPSSVTQLKQFLIEEWNSIPINLIQNLCIGYLDRINLVYNSKGKRLEPGHLYKYKKNRPIYNFIIPNELPKERKVYNNEKVLLYQKKEIKKLKMYRRELESNYNISIKKKKKMKKKFKRRDLNRMSIGIALSIINGPEEMKNKKKFQLLI